jgi:uncharacterized membrane protein
MLIAILWSIRSLIKNKHESLLHELSKLKTEILFLKNQISNINAAPSQKDLNKNETILDESKERQVNTQAAAPEDTIIIKEKFTPPQPIPLVQTKEEKEKKLSPTEAIESIHSEIEEIIPIAAIYKTIEEPPVYKPPMHSKKEKSFLEKNPDLEKFIGENLVNKIGIAILVLGIGYFVKYAIDKNWINEIGRVAIGLLCGGILIGLAHRLRKEFTAFSSVLVGGGIAVLYFTISLAFHDYHLFSQTLAFAMMVIVTAFAVLLSLAYNRIELAIVAIIGGFGSPFFVSTGQGNYIILFTYLLILNLGMLSLAYYKKWNLVNIICYFFTILIFGGWLISRFDFEIHQPLTVLLFALAFYMIFFAMNIVYNLKNVQPFKSLELSLLLSNTFLFFSTGLYLLSSPQLNHYKGVFTIIIGLFNLGFAYPLYKRGNTDKNLIFMLIGLVLTFISLAAPIQLKGHYITIFWAAEMVLLLWLSQKSGIKLIKQTSLLITGLLLVSLVLDWFKIYGSTSVYLIPFANKAFITGIFTVIAIALKSRLLNNETHLTFTVSFFNLKEYQNIIRGLFIGVLYVTLLLEIVHQIQYYYKEIDIRNIVVVCYHLSFVFILNLYFEKQKVVELLKINLVILSISIFIILLANVNIISLRNQILKFESPHLLFFYLHFYILLIGFYFIFKSHQILKNLLVNNPAHLGYLYWVTIILLLITASIELDHLAVYLMYNNQHTITYILNQNHKFGYAILWGISAFVLINIGLKRKIREIRIISLALFSLVVLKLFIYDINNISEAGRIVAFVLLGVLLLVVSFMYQRLKKLISSDKDISNNE